MKYILTAALAFGLFANASAQQTPQVQVIRTRFTPVNESSNMQIILDKLQVESQNTVVYPLMQMTQKALQKVQGLKKHSRNHGRIRTNNNAKPKRVMNPNRA